MATKAAVQTIFTAVDKITPQLYKMQTGADRFAVKAKAAFRAVVPEASRLNDIIKGVTIGNLLSKGITMAAGAIRNNVGAAINYASDLIEVQNVVDTVFGKSSKTIDAFAKSAGKSFGLTELQAKKFSSTFGAILGGLGIKEDAALGMSVNLTGLAGDLASFYNLDAADAFSKLQGGLMGKTQPLQSIGIDVSATSMEEFAKAQGLVWKNMDRTNQTMLRYKFIMEKTKLAQGDYQKPIASWAVSSKNATQAIGEMAGKLAVGLMPTLIRLADIVTDIAQRVSAWADKNKELIAAKLETYIDKLIKLGKTLYKNLSNIASAVLITVATIKAFSIAKGIYQGVTVAVKAYDAMLKIQLASTKAVTAAQTKLNLAMKANIIGLIVAAVVLLISLFVILASKVGGFVNALKVVGQTWMKHFLTPINLAISAIGGLLSLIGHIPGFDWAKSASEAVSTFQNKMNTLLTGSESTLLNSGFGMYKDPYNNALDAELARKREAEGNATEDEDNTQEDILAELKKMNSKVDDEIDAINGLNDKGGNSPARLRWGAMGAEDFWETTRLGM